MAFDRTKLQHVSSYSPLTNIFTLETTDDVTVAGYIPAGEGVRGGDKVIKVAITRAEPVAPAKVGLVTGREETAYWAKESADGKLTLTALA